MSDVDDLSDLIARRILDAADLDNHDTSGLLMNHYNVPYIVILETATELAKTILWKYAIAPRGIKK